jgi:hypothetical protein
MIFFSGLISAALRLCVQFFWGTCHGYSVRMVSLLAVLVGACAAQPAPAPVLVKPATKIATKPPAAVTCSDAAVILRGNVADERNAGPMKEEAIAKACLFDHWPGEVLECVGSNTQPRTCLDKLGVEQRGAYRKKMAVWNESFPDEALDEVAPVDEDKADFIECSDGIGDVSQYAPVLILKGPDRELALSMRRNAVLALCEDWSTEVRRCFERKEASGRCRGMLEPDQEQDLVDRLADIDTVMARIALAGKTDCKKVVDVHYADARWQGKLVTFKPQDKKKVIARSRAAMVKACADDKWSESLRGCIVAQGGDACFVASGITVATWGFPPSGLPIKSGIAECDAYADTLRALLTCTAIPRQAAQTMLDGHQQTVPRYLNMKPAERTEAAKSCAASDSAIHQSAKNLGCAI